MLYTSAVFSLQFVKGEEEKKNLDTKETGRPIETENSLKRIKGLNEKGDFLINRADDGH